jgi:hypothetical protein
MTTELPSLSLGKKMIRYMQHKNWRIRAINIVYLEDADPTTWQPKQGKIDEWDDARILLADDGRVIMSASATVEPGLWYTQNRLNDCGAFRTDNDVQFLDAWTLGDHKGQFALVQCRTIKGTRDGNEDGCRPGDVHDEGIFGVNQHTTGASQYAPAPSKVGRYSAGCYVGQYPKTHYNVFMPTLKGTGHEQFDTAIIPGDKFALFEA